MMPRSSITLLVFVPALVAVPLLGAQRSSTLLAEGRAQLAARNLDSAITLFRAVTNDPRTDSTARAEGLMWLGVAVFYEGQDSSALDNFRQALRSDPLLLAADRLTRLDSTLGDWWEREQTLAICGEALPAWGWPSTRLPETSPLNADARAGQAPEFVTQPRLRYPDDLRQAGVQGRVLARIIIDSTGRPERGSGRILASADHGFNKAVIQMTEGAGFSSAVSRGRRVRSCVVLPVDFSIRRD